MKLNQCVALQAGKKQKAKDTLTEAYHQIKKPDLFTGLTRTYQARDDGGEVLPDERKHPQMRVNDLIRGVRKDLVEMFDITATQDYANCAARADIILDGKKLLENVPVPHLLWLEKQLVDLRTFVSSLPVLDPTEDWAYSSDQDGFVSKAVRTNRTKKVPKSHVKYEATAEHPAQVEMYMEDIWVGTWTQVKFSGCLPAKAKNEMLERVGKLVEAVKLAREEANSLAVQTIKSGNQILDYVFGKA